MNIKTFSFITVPCNKILILLPIPKLISEHLRDYESSSKKELGNEIEKNAMVTQHSFIIGVRTFYKTQSKTDNILYYPEV